MGQFESSFERTASQNPAGLLGPGDLQNITHPTPGAAPAQPGPAPGDAFANKPLAFGPDFHPFAERPNGTGPIGINTTSPFPSNYIPRVTDLPPNAVPQGGWDGNALAPPPVPVQRTPAYASPPAAPGYPPAHIDVHHTPSGAPVAAFDWTNPDSYMHSVLADRGVSFASSAYAVAKWTKFAGQPTLPGIKDLRSMTSADWKAGLQTEMGRAVGYSWLADSLLDGFGPTKNYTTSFTTIALDTATPLIAKYALGKWGTIGAVGISAAAHLAEKWWLERPLEK